MRKAIKDESMTVVMNTTDSLSTKDGASGEHRRRTAEDRRMNPGPADLSTITSESPPTRLMVFGLAHRDGRVFGAEVHDVAAQCGIGVETIRSCMRRLVAEDLFEREGEGKDAVYTATPAGHLQLSVTTQRHMLAYSLDASGRGWDGRWRIVSFAIPEVMRSARDTFREHIRSLGGADIQPGLYVSPHDWTGELGIEAERLGIADKLCTFSTKDLDVNGVTDARELAATLWPLDEVADRYRTFIDTYHGVPEDLKAMRQRGETISERDFLPGALNIAIRFNECFELDPLLPRSLLPKPWPGYEARKLLAACRHQGMLARHDKDGPALFRVFDEATEHLP